MVSTLQGFHCGFLKDALSSTKDTSINFFSLNFTSIETEGERVSSSQNERTFGEGGEGGGRGVSRHEQGRRRLEEEVKIRESWVNVSQTKYWEKRCFD